MNLRTFMTFNAILFVGLGIAFALYGPLMVAMFGTASLETGDAVLYWYAVSFARLFGAALFGLGFLIWAVQGQVHMPETRRSVLFAILLFFALSLFIAVIQQYNIWQSPSGWITIAVLLLFTAGYGYFLVRPKAD